MKALLCIFVLLSTLQHTYAAGDDVKGYLVIEVERTSYKSERKIQESTVTQSFKVPLSTEFFSQFKHLPSQKSMGTGFLASGGSLKAGNRSTSASNGTTSFAWWIHRTNDNRWSINMWGQGVETVKGSQRGSADPSVSDYVTIKHWEDLDMTYQISYVNMPEGINVQLTVRYVDAGDKKTLDAIPEAPVKKADGSTLFKGDDLSKRPMEIQCLFQED